MDKLYKLRDSVLEFLSPTKRRHTLPVTTPSRNPTQIQRPIQPATEPRNRNKNAVATGRVGKKTLSLSNTRLLVRKSRNRTKSDDEYVNSPEDEQASVTLISHQSIAPEDSSSQVNIPIDDDSDISMPADKDRDSSIDMELDSEAESELDAEAKVHQFLDHQTELARRQETLERIKEGDWHVDEIALFQKLSMRGLEPLLPSHWSFDFRTCPSTIFSSNEEETFINSKSGCDFRGK